MAFLAAAAALAVPTISAAEDVSAPVILQWFDSKHETMEHRAADVFEIGIGAIWAPPPGRADTGDQSVGYDVYDRFDLGSTGKPTLYGTETGMKQTIDVLHRAGVDYHVDFVINHNGYSGTNGQADRDAFIAAGGYPGLAITLPNDIDGDFHGAFSGGDHDGRLAGLIDIAHEKNHLFIRNPVDPNDTRNLPAGTVPQFGRLANVATENNRRFYPDLDGPFIEIDDPATGENNLRIYQFNTTDPSTGDATVENATGYIMRNAQWLVQAMGVDGFRIDAAKHVPVSTLHYFDRAVYQANPRKLLDGSTKHVFSYGEVFDGNKAFLQSYIRKDANLNDDSVGGNRDVLDFAQFFALRDNLTGNGFQNDWGNVVGAGMDVNDDGAHNGSQGVLFASSHDEGGGPFLNNVAHAYILMQPGNAVVYHNGKEHGDRDFPKGSRADILGNENGLDTTITNLIRIRETHGRGDYRERFLNKEYYAFERSGSSLTLLSNRNDGGTSDWTNFLVDLPYGTPMIELTGNAQANGLPEVVTVTDDFFGGPKYVRTKFLHNDNQDKGFLIYGLSGPQGSLALSNTAGQLAGETPTNSDDRDRRLSSVDIVTADSFGVTLNTNAVNLLGSIRDRDADGDNALIKLDGGLDLNNSGQVDHRTPNTVQYGFEEFTGANANKSPGRFNDDGNGSYGMTIDTTDLSEGYHFLEVRAFRHRTDGGPAIYTPFRKTVYVDRLDPVAAIDSFKPFGADGTGDNDIWLRSTDKTADSMHVFLNLPENISHETVLAFVTEGAEAAGIDLSPYGRQMDKLDRDIFKTGFFGIGNGNNVVTAVTFEITGNSNVQRFTGIRPHNSRGAGLGDLSFNGVYETGDLAGTSHGFEAVLYSQNDTFNPAADLNADGRVDNHDLFLLRQQLTSENVSQGVHDELTNVLLRRGNINGEFGTDAWDIDALYGKFQDAPTWYLDLNVDGDISQLDVDALVQNVFETEYGDVSLSGGVTKSDLITLLDNYGQNLGWAHGNFDGLGGVALNDMQLLLDNYTGARGTLVVDDALGSAERNLLTSNGFTLLPEPSSAVVLALGGLALLQRRRKRVGWASPTNSVHHNNGGQCPPYGTSANQKTQNLLQRGAS